MKKSRYTAGQIAFALRQTEGGAPVLEVCRKMGAQTSTGKRGDRGHEKTWEHKNVGRTTGDGSSCVVGSVQWGERRIHC